MLHFERISLLFLFVSMLILTLWHVSGCCLQRSRRASDHSHAIENFMKRRIQKGSESPIKKSLINNITSPIIFGFILVAMQRFAQWPNGKPFF